MCFPVVLCFSLWHDALLCVTTGGAECGAGVGRAVSAVLLRAGSVPRAGVAAVVGRLAAGACLQLHLRRQGLPSPEQSTASGCQLCCRE